MARKALILAAVLVAACHREAPPLPSGAVLRVSQRNEPADLDPATASLPDEFFIIRALGEGLVLPAMPGQSGPTPGAAAAWEVSPDRLTWTFHLRPDLAWSNNEPLTAQDFVDSFHRVLAPATPAPRAELFAPAASFSAPDARTVVVRLKRPNARFLDYVASGPWIPVNPRVVARFGRDWTRPGHYVGNGPFVLDQWMPNRRIIVRRNPRYHGAAAPHVDEIDFIRYDDGDTEDRAFRAHEVDVTMAVPTERIPIYRREDPAVLHSAPLLETRYLAFNTRRPPLDNPDVRRALSAAIDRVRLVREVLRANQRAAFSLLPADGPSGRTDPMVGPAAAQRLLAQAGYPGGKGFPRLELSGWTGNAGNLVLEAVQQMWLEELGIATTLVNRDARVHIAALQSGNYDIALVALIPWVEDRRALLDSFTSDDPNNYPHWRDPAYDRLVADGDLKAAEQRLNEACIGAPLYYNQHTWLMRPYVHGWEENGLWQRTYLDVRLDPH